MTTLIEVTIKVQYEIKGTLEDYDYKSINDIKTMEDVENLECNATTAITKFVSIREMDESELEGDNAYDHA